MNFPLWRGVWREAKSTETWRPAENEGKPKAAGKEIRAGAELAQVKAQLARVEATASK